jgi:Tfp pilus assembly protein PilV
MKILCGADGFSVIEILIAAVIMSITSIGTVTLTIGVMHGNLFSKRLATATILTKDRLEQAKRIGYQNAGTIVGTENYGMLTNIQ